MQCISRRSDNLPITSLNLVADIIALVVAIAFGAVHYIAWFYAFPSHIEQLMWRAAVISIVAIPVIMALGIVVISGVSGTLGEILLSVWCSLCYRLRSRAPHTTSPLVHGT